MPAASLPFPTDLTEREWAILAPLLPPPKPGARRRTVDLRRILTGICSIVRSECQWRLLPRAYGPWSTVYASFVRLLSPLASCRILGVHPHHPAGARPQAS